jgi:transcriptional regulator with XRE-family HTH domain
MSGGVDPLSLKVIGQRLCQFRKAMGMTRAAAAEKLHVSCTTIANIERGKILPPASLLYTLTVKLGLNSNWLLTGCEPMAIKKAEIYWELERLMQVPEVETYLLNQLKEIKTHFKK